MYIGGKVSNRKILLLPGPAVHADAIYRSLAYTIRFLK